VLTRAEREATSQPGQWWAGLSGVDRPRWVSVRCPLCGKSASISRPGGEGHQIAADGTVTPSLVCPHEPCTWHVMAKLAGWIP